MNNFVTLKDAAQLLNVSSATLRNWDKQGKLKAERHPINGYRIYDLPEIKKLLVIGKENNSQTDTLSTQPIVKNNFSLFKTAVKLMSKAFRDSEGGGLLERFEEISKILFTKLYDEKFNNNKGFSFNSNSNNDLIYNSVSKTYIEALRKFPNIFVNGRSKLTIDLKAVANVAKILKDFNLSSMAEDIKGKVYEEIIKNTFDKSENQQYFTPRVIINFIINLINPDYREKICDPACGSGGFLIASLEHLFYKDKNYNYTKEIFDYSEENILGIEIDSRMAWIAQMNIIMHGGSYSSIKYLSDGGTLSFRENTLKVLPNNYFDVIVTNPPFGSDYDKKEDLEQFISGKNKKSRRRSVLFLEKAINLLKYGGRLGIILEENIFNNSANKDIRSFILKHTIIDAVISLPDTAFMPYASVKTSILLLRKKLNKSEIQGKVLMANIESTGFSPTGEPIYSEEKDDSGKLKILSDFPLVLESWKKFKSKQENNYNVLNKNCFIVDIHNNNPETRLDTLFFHPAKEIANNLLLKTRFPLFKLAEITTLYNKLIMPSIEYPDDTIRYIGLANILPFQGSYYISEIFGEKIKSTVRVFEADSVIFSKLRPELRKVIYIPKNEESGVVSSECFVFKANEYINPEYLAIILRSDLVYGQIIFQITGIGRPRIGKSDVLNIKIPVPELKLQNEIVNSFNISLKNFDNLNKQSEKIKEQASKLISDAYNQIESILCH